MNGFMTGIKGGYPHLKTDRVVDIRPNFEISVNLRYMRWILNPEP